VKPAPEERNVYSATQLPERTKDFQAITGYKHFVPTGRKLVMRCESQNRRPDPDPLFFAKALPRGTLLGKTDNASQEDLFSLLPLGEGLGMRVYGAILF